MEIQRFEDEDIHICGQCKARFSDVQLFIQHKDYQCPVKIARKCNEVQKVPTSNPVTSTSLSESGVVDLIEGNTADVPTTIQFGTGNQDSFRRVLYNVKQSEEQFQSKVDRHEGQQHVDISLADTYQNHIHFTEDTESQTDHTVHITGNQEYVLFSNDQGTEHYGGTVNQVIEIKPIAAVDQNYTAESQDLNSSKQYTTLTSQPLLGLVPDPQSAAQPTSQLPAFISGEITDSVPPPTSAGENLAVQIQERIEEGIENSQPVQYTFTFNNNEERSGQTCSVVSNADATFTPKITYSLSTNSDLFRPISPARETKTTRQKVDKSQTDSKKVKKPLEKKYSCSTCNYKSAYYKDLERHSRIHTGEKPYKCTVCDKSFNRNDKLSLHMKYHQNERSFQCDLCEYKAVEKSSLKKHMKTHIDYRPYGCQVCPYKARTSSGLQIHLRIHTGDAPFKCKECDAEFKVNSDLTRHKRVHSGEKPYLCTEPGCTYRCAIKSNLRSHMNTNHKYENMLTCETCDFKTSSMRALFEHNKTHRVVNELRCSECNYQCSSKSALRNHMKMHNDERHKCNHCSYSSYQIGNVQAHMKRKHNSGMGNRARLLNKSKGVNSGNQKASERSRIKAKCQKHFKCDQCDAAFVREDSLRCHLKQHSDSPLSTAYAVLKLQKPVINPNSSASKNQTGSNISSNTTEMVEPGSENAVTQSGSLNYSPIKAKNNSPIVLKQDQSEHGQTVNLGINDILAAARLSGLTSCGNSPTYKKPLEQFVFQDGQDCRSNTATLSSVNNNIENINNAITLSEQQPDDSTVQIMQNVSLPYMRLPDGQILILTGQNSASTVIQQPNSVPSSQIISNTEGTLQARIIAQQPTTEQQQIIQIPENFGANSAQNISSTPDSGAIPIQIILPNDSQQAMPLVSQLLSSVINKGTGEILGQTASNIQSQKEVVNVGMQNFVVQIPTQQGSTKDLSGVMGESQSFVLQIPGTGNFT